MTIHHLSVALELRVEIDRLLALHARLGSDSCGYEVARADYQSGVKQAIQNLADMESKALHLHSREVRNG